ncbi:MAG TPA: ABC transporter ATP-binding protein [Thermodesulfobacteriaceae bacterium]|nr:ABC transporter ATP-binding protein [Thermodesulfobacteriaceae bacterium]
MNDGYELHEVCYAYDGVRAVDDFTITLPRGKFYGIVGPNGCGKTTLLDILIGSRNPDTGTVRFAGRVMHEYSRRELARQVALVPQDFAIGFAFTVEEVVLMGRHPYISRFASPSAEDWRIVEDAMDTIGIRHFTTRYVNELSGGEKQRVVVARALAQDTPVLLFDEATSNLDVRYTLHIFNVVRRLVNDEGKTVIAVIQNLNLAAAYCDEILFMKGGRLLKHGPVSRVMKPSTIKEVFEVESEMRMDSYSGSLQVSFRYRSS